jgi:predicted phage terminase large subunit-like protein
VGLFGAGARKFCCGHLGSMGLQRIEIRPQVGPQEMALSSPADVVIMGGAKGGGKSWAMRIFPLRYVGKSGFHAVIFRRTLIQVQASGGQWDSSYKLYPYFGAKENRSRLRWTFPAGATITFSYLKQDKDWLNWQGSEVAMYCFDQLEEFTCEQFLQILGCMRTTSGVPTQLVGTCNPDFNSWLRNFVDPWIAEDGYVDLSQNGQVKHFTVENGQVIWVGADWRDRNGNPAKSAVYINADVFDNKILLEQDPNYLSNLQAQSEVDRERFLGIRGRGGNWNARAVAGKVFKFEWFGTVANRPKLAGPIIRFWDFASSDKEQKGDDPDRTSAVLMAVWEWRELPPEPGRAPKRVPAKVIVLHEFCDYLTPGQLDKKIVELAAQDGPGVKQRWFRDPGQAGVYQDAHLRSLLAGRDAGGVISQISKAERSGPLSKACEYGEVYLLEGFWNYEFCNELVGFPDMAHDDRVDAAAGAYNELSGAGALVWGESSYQ